MRTIIHIGAEKTGTTALQNCLSSSRDRLAAAGVCYPRIIAAAQHFPLVLYALDDSRSYFFAERNQRFASDRQAYRRRVVRQLERQLASSQPDTLVLSSELLAAQLRDVDELARLRDLLDRWTDEYLVVMYLRRQDRARASLHSTDVRVGSDSPDILGACPFSEMGFDYAGVLDLWAQVFGADALRPRVYEQARAREGLLADFNDAADLGIEPGMLSQVADRANPALSAAAEAMALAYNRLNGGRPAITSQEARARRMVMRLIAARYPGTPRRPGRDEARAYAGKFADGNLRVSELWFGGEPLFDDSFDEYPDVADALPEHDPAELARVRAEVAD